MRSLWCARVAVVAVAMAAVAGCGGDSGDDSVGSAEDSETAPAEARPCAPADPGEGLGQAEPSEIDEGVVINRYDVRLTIADNGDLAAAEELIVEFPDSEHHGIYRDFTEDDYVVADPAGTVDGEPHSEVERGADAVRLVLGRPDVTLDAGEHSFDITYSADAVLEPSTDLDQDWQFDASVIDPGWGLDIEDAEVTIHLPAAAGDVSCVVGLGATATVTGAGTTTLVLTADEVPAGSGVRVLVGLDADPVSG